MAPSDQHSNPFFEIPLIAASLAALIACNALFIASKDELTPLAASAFAVAGLIAIMPWQLAQALDIAKHAAARRSLIYAGCQMSAASLFFIAAAILRYFYFHHQELISIKEQHHVTLKIIVSTLSGGSFLIASIFFMLGLVRFGNLLSSILLDQHEETK